MCAIFIVAFQLKFSQNKLWCLNIRYMHVFAGQGLLQQGNFITVLKNQGRGVVRILQKMYFLTKNYFEIFIPAYLLLSLVLYM